MRSKSNRNSIAQMAEVVVTEQAQRELDELGRTIHFRVLGVLERLKQWPQVSGAKPLRHELAGKYRIRTGDYRVQFRIVGRSVIIERIGHRDGFYED